MDNIYNLIAELCSYIINNCTEDFFVLHSCISSSEKKKIYTQINTLIPELVSKNDDGFVVNKLTKDSFTEPFYNTLLAYAEELKEQKDYSSLVGFIQMLDDSLEILLKERIHELEEEDFVVVLNTNRETTGIGLLPRCSCVWERKHRLSQCYNRMDNFLFNILLMENKILGELIDKHIFLKKDFFKDFSKTGILKIASTPLRLEPKFKTLFFEENKISFFKVEYDNPESEEDNLLIWNKIVSAQKENADIIVFPEVLGNNKTVSFIQEKINTLSEEEKETLPALMILPSVCKEKQNIVTILGKHGEVVATQCKQNPFRLETKEQSYLEGIFANCVVNIFHYEGIGRFAILICKDFLTTKYMEQLMRCFKLTLIIVPAFSSGSYDFKQSFDLCAHDDCNVVWINSCAAVKKGKESNMQNIGYVRKRIGVSDDQSQTLCNMPSCEGLVTGNCNHDCIFFEEIKGV